MLRRTARKYPFVTYAVIVNAALAVILLLASFGGGYDDGGIGGVATLLLLVWCVVAFPFFVPIEALSGLPHNLDTILGWPIGLSLCIACEVILHRVRARRKQSV